MQQWQQFDRPQTVATLLDPPQHRLLFFRFCYYESLLSSTQSYINVYRGLLRRDSLLYYHNRQKPHIGSEAWREGKREESFDPYQEKLERPERGPTVFLIL